MEDAQLNKRQPDANYCFGREKLCSNVVASGWRSRAVLLFGGRQSGKTTLLLRIARDLNLAIDKGEGGWDLDIPIYVDLMRLPYDATPATFFRFLANLVNEECQKRVPGFQVRLLPSVKRPTDGSLELFVEDIKKIFTACADVNLRIMFLLDESKRVIGDRFPRGFQDNLFTLLFSNELSIGDRIAVIFAGAQDLYHFCEDDTSPIGSRASMHIIPNLSTEAVSAIIKSGLSAYVPSELETVANQVFLQTSGQAGLTIRFAEKLFSITTKGEKPDLKAIAAEIQKENVGLLRLWVLSLSNEARTIINQLSKKGKLTLGEMAKELHDKGLDPIVADKVCEELQFTGVAKFHDGCLSCANQIFWGYLKPFTFEESGNKDEQKVWHIIEETELTLRDFVRKAYEDRWQEKAIEMMEQALGINWKRIKATQSKSSKSFPLSPDKFERELMSCMYMGDLLQLMIGDIGWPLFNHMFRDKRQLEDYITAISPVRTFEAHFSSVPAKELDRCRILKFDS